MTDNRAFLELFDNSCRSYVTNLFLSQVRHGARTPYQVLSMVEQELRQIHRRARHWPSIDFLNRTELVDAMLNQHHAEAFAFAIWPLMWEALPRAEKERQKVARDEAFMQSHPAMVRQRTYLAAPGYTGEITSKAQASQLIDHLRSGKPDEAQP